MPPNKRTLHSKRKLTEAQKLHITAQYNFRRLHAAYLRDVGGTISLAAQPTVALDTLQQNIYADTDPLEMSSVPLEPQVTVETEAMDIKDEPPSPVTSTHDSEIFAVESINLDLKQETSELKLDDSQEILPEFESVFVKEEAIHETMQVSHSNQDEPLLCENCSKLYRSKTCFLHHLRSSTRRYKSLQRYTYFSPCVESLAVSCDESCNESKPCRLNPRDKMTLLTCKECNTSSKNNFMLHVTHDHMRVFTCTVCKASLLSQNNLNIHLALHLKFKCQTCEWPCTSEKALKAHAKVHTHLFNCVQCRAAFTSQCHLDDHVRLDCDIVTNDNVTCKRCSLRFVSAQVLHNHIMACHSNCFRCSICQEEFMYIYRMEAHMRARHSVAVESVTDALDYPCILCEKRFASRVFLTQHKYSEHMKPRLYPKTSVAMSEDIVTSM